MPGKRPAGELIVLLHGLWMPRVSMTPLARRLAQGGFAVCRFGYPSTRRTVAENADALAEFVQARPAARIHFVAHSLGGLVVHRLVHRHADLPPGRVVALGTPFAGSRVAARLCGCAPGRALLGRSIEQGLLGGYAHWSAPRELGVIAGRLPLGAGRLLARLPQPHDGTVAVAETRVRGATAHLVLPVSHFGLLFSPQVAHAACAFLRSGGFPDARLRG